MNNSLHTGLTPPNPAEPAEWVKNFTDVCVEALGLKEWDLYLIMRGEVRDRDNEILDGQTCADPTYMTAHVELPLSINDRQSHYDYATVLHELLHVTLANQNNAVWSIIDLVPEELRPHAEKLWKHGNEHDIEMLSRSLAKVLREFDFVEDDGEHGEGSGADGAADHANETDKGAGGCDACAAPRHAEAQVPQPTVQMGVIGVDRIDGINGTCPVCFEGQRIECTCIGDCGSNYCGDVRFSPPHPSRRAN